MAKFLDVDGLQHLVSTYIKPELTDYVNNKEKNLVPLDFSVSDSSLTVTYANNKLVINGSPTKAQSAYSTVYLNAGTYALSGCPSGGGVETYQCELRTTTGSTLAVTDIGNGTTFILQTSGNYRYNVRIAGGYTASNLEISPMICTLDDWNVSHSYEPYKKNIASNSEIMTMWENN